VLNNSKLHTKEHTQIDPNQTCQTAFMPTALRFLRRGLRKGQRSSLLDPQKRGQDYIVTAIASYEDMPKPIPHSRAQRTLNHQPSWIHVANLDEPK
jgi:hypothetical protein